jgi:hypothetical protein
MYRVILYNDSIHKFKLGFKKVLKTNDLTHNDIWVIDTTKVLRL